MRYYGNFLTVVTFLNFKIIKYVKEDSIWVLMQRLNLANIRKAGIISSYNKIVGHTEK